MSLTVRIFCFTPSGAVRSVPLRLASKLHALSDPPRVPELAGTSTRFAELVVELKQRKPAYVIRASYYLLRFSEAGVPDSARLTRQMLAALDASWMTASGGNEQDDTVIDRRDQFVHRGSQWSPTPAEVRRLEDAALGRLKTSRLIARPGAPVSEGPEA